MFLGVLAGLPLKICVEGFDTARKSRSVVFLAERLKPPLRIAVFTRSTWTVCYTTMTWDKSMYRITFRILETLDEHFCKTTMFIYHCGLNGFGLSDAILQKLCHPNAEKILSSRRMRAHT
jgi:hypothetical protein